jgi:hypothetical protein
MLRAYAQIEAQDIPQNSAAHDEAVPITFEAETCSPRKLVLGEQWGQLIDKRRAMAGESAPYMDVPGGEPYRPGRIMPARATVGHGFIH